MEGKWFTTSYRRNLVDMHIDDWDDSFLSKLDPQTYVALLKTAHVKSAMVYANSHVGYCYWPTKTGQMHRGLRGKDVLGEITDLCHREGIDVIAYYSLIFNNWAYDNNPSWRILDVDGKPSRERGGRAGRYGVCCPNNVDYRAFVTAQVEELLAAYDFEGIFFDMTFWPGICYCPACRARFESEVGGEMPDVINWQDERWIEFQKKREEWLVEFAAFATNTAKHCRPEITVEHNSAPLTQASVIGTTLALREHNDYIGGDLYGGFAQQSFICKLYDSITPNKPFEFMTSRCYPSLRDHTTLKPKEMLEVHTFLAMAHNGAFFFIDAIDPVGTLNPRVYETMGEIFSRSREYEPFLGGELCQDVAVYFSLDSKMDFGDNGKRVTAAGWRVPHLDAALGAARSLREAHIPFGVISKNSLTDTSKYQVIVLPEVLFLDEEEAQALRRHVENGGGLYASGRAPLARLADLFGVEIEGQTAEDVTYMAPTDAGRGLFPGIEPAFPLSIFRTQVKARALDSDSIAATLVLPYTDPSNGLRLASIHSNPPGVATDYASLVQRRVGNGRVAWAAAPIEAADQPPHRQVFVQIVRSLAARPFSFAADAPPAVEITLSHQPAQKRYLISLINEQELLPPVPAHNLKVRVKLDGKTPERAALLPSQQPLSWRREGDYAEVDFPELNIFQMALLQYE